MPKIPTEDYGTPGTDTRENQTTNRIRPSITLCRFSVIVQVQLTVFDAHFADVSTHMSRQRVTF